MKLKRIRYAAGTFTMLLLSTQAFAQSAPPPSPPPPIPSSISPPTEPTPPPTPTPVVPAAATPAPTPPSLPVLDAGAITQPFGPVAGQPGAPESFPGFSEQPFPAGFQDSPVAEATSSFDDFSTGVASVATVRAQAERSALEPLRDDSVSQAGFGFGAGVGPSGFGGDASRYDALLRELAQHVATDRSAISGAISGASEGAGVLPIDLGSLPSPNQTFDDNNQVEDDLWRVPNPPPDH